MILQAAIESVTCILGQISDLNSEYGEAVRLMEGLSGGLHVMLSFVERRINDQNPVDPVAMSHLENTLGSISRLIEEIRVALRRKIGCFHYGEWLVYGAPLLNGCLGKAGSTKFVKRLHDAEGDLNGTIKFLELQMTASAVSALSVMSNDKAAIVEMFGNAETRKFWTSNFGELFSVHQKEFAAALIKEARRALGDDRWSNDSSLSRSYTYCAYLAADIARSAVVDARALAAAAGEKTVAEWLVAGLDGKARTALLPGHHGAVTCMACGSGHLVTGGSDGTVKIFALVDGKPTHSCTLIGHNDPVTCVSVSDSEIASGSVDGFIRVWSLHDGFPKACYPVSTAVRSVSCYGALVAFSCESPEMCITVKRMDTGVTVNKLHGHAGGVRSLTFAGYDSVFSVGADRCLKEWSPDNAVYVRCVTQAHSNSVEHVLHHEDFVATVTNKDVRFYDPKFVSSASGGFVAKIGSSHEGHSSVLAACVVRPLGAVVLAMREALGAMFASRLVTVFHADGGEVRFETLPTYRSDYPTSLSASENTVFAGMESGQIVWYDATEEGLVPRGSIGSARQGSPPSLRDSEPAARAPLLVSGQNCVATAGQKDEMRFHFGGDRSVVRESASALCWYERGWAAACGKALRLYDERGRLMNTFDLFGTAASLQWVNNKFLADVRVAGGDSRIICEIDASTGRTVDLTREPCARDAPGAALVLGDRYLAWPGYFEGSLSAMDTRVLSVVDSVRYDNVDIDPITIVCGVGSSACFVTVHGGLDLLLWKDMSGPVRRLTTFAEPVTSLFISSDDADVVAGLADGSVVATSGASSKVFVDHALGGAAVAPSPGGFYSVGSEGSLVCRSLHQSS
jgi:WD40 repeat protein